MSKKKINELNMVSRFIGDFFDGISQGTADRLLKKAKQRGMPPEILKGMEKDRLVNFPTLDIIVGICVSQISRQIWLYYQN